MAKVSLDRAKVYLDGRDITKLLTDLDVGPEQVEDVIDVLWRPQPIHALFHKRVEGSFSARHWVGDHYLTAEEAVVDILTRYDQSNGFTFEDRTWLEITDNTFREIVEARQTDFSGSGIAIDDDPGHDMTMLIRGDRLDYLTLDLDAESITASEGLEITNDINTDTVYIQEADIVTGENKYTLYDAKSGGSATTMSLIATAESEPNVGQNVTLTIKCTNVGDTATLDSNSDDSEIYFVAEQSNSKRHWLEVRMYDAAESVTVKLILKYVTFRVSSETYEMNVVPSFSVNFTAEDYEVE